MIFGEGHERGGRIEDHQIVGHGVGSDGPAFAAQAVGHDHVERALCLNTPAVLLRPLDDQRTLGFDRSRGEIFNAAIAARRHTRSMPNVIRRFMRS